MGLAEDVYKFLKDRGAKYEVNHGIVYVTDIDGSEWDFTEPLPTVNAEDIKEKT